MSTLKVNAIEKKDADQTLTVKDATLTGATITTGSLASGVNLDSATFPAGHILQVVGNTTPSSGHATTGQGTGTLISQAITINDYINNDILISISGFVQQSAGGSGGHGTIYITGGSLGSNASGQRYLTSMLYLQGDYEEESISLSHWDTAPPSSNEAYGLYYIANASQVITYKFTISIFEVKR